jgi:hypothetical protein
MVYEPAAIYDNASLFHKISLQSPQFTQTEKYNRS